jgi:hypothetical protein
LQFPHFRFQISVPDEQRLHSVARVTAARRNRACFANYLTSTDPGPVTVAWSRKQGNVGAVAFGRHRVRYHRTPQSPGPHLVKLVRVRV